MSDDLRRLLTTAKAIQDDINALGINQEPIQLPQQVPEELRYIMWRYWNDHSGEDHRERYRVAADWLAGVSMSVMPAGRKVELTPERVAALQRLVALAEVELLVYANTEAGPELLSAVWAVRAMLAEVK